MGFIEGVKSHHSKETSEFAEMDVKHKTNGIGDLVVVFYGQGMPAGIDGEATSFGRMGMKGEGFTITYYEINLCMWDTTVFEEVFHRGKNGKGNGCFLCRCYLAEVAIKSQGYFWHF